MNQSIVVRTGAESLILQCRVKGDGVTVHWQKNQQNVSSMETFVVQRMTVLVNDNVTKEDEGVYKCVATNSGGSVTSEEATVTINGQV